MHTLNLQSLGMNMLDLGCLDVLFTDEEVWSVVKEMAPDRAPGPDGFTAEFYQKAWPIIKDDIMAGDDRGPRSCSDSSSQFGEFSILRGVSSACIFEEDV